MGAPLRHTHSYQVLYLQCYELSGRNVSLACTGFELACKLSTRLEAPRRVERQQVKIHGTLVRGTVYIVHNWKGLEIECQITIFSPFSAIVHNAVIYVNAWAWIFVRNPAHFR